MSAAEVRHFPAPAPIPNFEGMSVATATVKVSGNAPLESTEELVVSIDDVVRMVGEYRVVGVAFKVDPKTGDTIREQILKPVKLEPVPWDPSDPNDDGVVRARPGVR